MKAYVGLLAICAVILAGCATAMKQSGSEREGPAGCVLLTFRINENGAASDIKIVKSYPPGFYDHAAVEAVEEMKLSNWTKRRVNDTGIRNFSVPIVFNGRSTDVISKCRIGRR